MDDRTPSEASNAYGRVEQLSALLVSCWSDGEASIIRQLLASYGIPCQLASDLPHTVFPICVDGLGEVRVMIPPSRLDEARVLLAEHRRHGFRIVRGGRGDA